MSITPFDSNSVLSKNTFFSFKDHHIRYVDTGNSGPVLFCNTGVGGSLELWSHQLMDLQDRFRVIAWDYPGHGLSSNTETWSDLEDIADIGLALLAHLGIEKYSLVGNSMGGAIALRMARNAQDNVDHIFLLNSATLSRSSPFPFRLMSIPKLGEIMSAPGKQAYERQMLAIFHEPSSVPTLITDAIQRNTLSEKNQLGLLKCVRIINSLGGQRRHLVDESVQILRNLACTITAIHGKNDSVIPVSASLYLKHYVNNVVLEIIDDCGHTPQVEKPEIVNRLIQETLARRMASDAS